MNSYERVAQAFQGEPIVSVRPSADCLTERVIRFSQSDEVIKAYIRPNGTDFAVQLPGMKHSDYAKSKQY